MSNLYIQEEYVNKTEGYCFGDSEVYESRHDNKGDLYRACRDEYGRCVSKVYVDTDKGEKVVGWVFEV